MLRKLFGSGRGDGVNDSIKRRSTKKRVLIVEDDPAISDVLYTFLEGKGYEILSANSCSEAARIFDTTPPELAILDYSLPDGNALNLVPRIKSVDRSIPLILLTGYGSIELAVNAIKLGVDQFLTKPIELSALLLAVERAFENSRNGRPQLAVNSQNGKRLIDPFAGKSFHIQRLADLVRKVASTDSPILVLGETGTGKGVLARWLHQNGPRYKEPFVDLNCAGLARELLETELFGHEKGAFTGAVQSKLGLLEIAHKGTVLLDEIGDVDLQVQPKLLKVLEDKHFHRLGDTRERQVDIRLIAATHHNLARLVREQRFRSDLYFRINTVPLFIPALRDRAEDIPILSRQILDTFTTQVGKGPFELTPGALSSLQSYSWPGNIRELRNVLERAALISENTTFTEKDLQFEAPLETESEGTGTQITLREVERRHIEQILKQEGGRVESAAKKLGIPRSSLYSKLKQFHIEPAASRHSR